MYRSMKLSPISFIYLDYICILANVVHMIKSTLEYMYVIEDIVQDIFAKLHVKR